MGARWVIVVVLVIAALAGCGGGGSAPPAVTSSPTPPVVDRGTDSVASPTLPTGPREAAVPILMYHVVAKAPPAVAYPELWVPPGRFAQEMGALAHAGYHATTLAVVWRAWHGHGTMPRDPIVVSFDDGYQSQATAAWPTLDALGWPGVLNLAVKNVGLAGGLSRREVSAMISDGWEVDAHTLTHVDLTAVDATRLRQEVAGSRTWLQHAFDAPVDFFCYPAGRYNPGVEAAVRAAGYMGATTENLGFASHRGDPYALPRVRVTPSMTGADLVALLRRLRSV